MGCNNSKDVVNRIQMQEKKIDDLVKINKKLESRLNEMYQTSLTHGRSGNDTTSDLTNLKLTMDSRFNKLEMRVQRIHNDFRLKLFDGINEKLGDNNIDMQSDDDKNDKKLRETITLDLDKESNPPEKMTSEQEAHWNELLQESQKSLSPISKQKTEPQPQVIQPSQPKPQPEQQQTPLQKDQLTQSHIERSPINHHIIKNRSGGSGTVTVKKEAENGGNLHIILEGTLDKANRNTMLPRIEPANNFEDNLTSNNVQNVEDKSENSQAIAINHDDIKMNIESIAMQSSSKIDDSKFKSKGRINAADIFDDEKVKKIYNDVQKMMFKNSSKISQLPE